MVEKTLTRMDLSEAVFNAVGLSKNESADLVENVLKHMADALVDGEQVKISSFGTFSVRNKTERVGRNPKTRRGSIVTSSPVLGLRPIRSFLERTWKVAKDDSFTVSPRTIASQISSSTASTSSADSVRDRPTFR